MAPDLTEARDLAAMWQARAEAAEAERDGANERAATLEHQHAHAVETMERMSANVTRVEAALDVARAKTSAFAAVLRAICRADRTRYDHHEPRAWDGKRPKEDGGTIWLTPREKAESALKRMARNGDITAAEADWRADEVAKVAP